MEYYATVKKKVGYLCVLSWKDLQGILLNKKMQVAEEYFYFYVDNFLKTYVCVCAGVYTYIYGCVFKFKSISNTIQQTDNIGYIWVGY